MSVRDLLLAVALMCLWGFNFSVIKLGAEQIHPIMLTALRFMFATLPIIFFVKRPNVHPKYLIAYGVTFGLGVWGVMTWSITLGVSAGMAGLLMQLSIVFSLILGVSLFNETLTLSKLIGAVFAVLGLTVALTLTDGSVSAVGVAMSLIAALSWSLTAVIVKRANTQQVFAFSVWGMLFAPVPLLTIALSVGGMEAITQLPTQMNAEVWFSILFQAYPTTLLGYWFYNQLTMRYPLATVAPLTLLVPVFGLLGSYLFYNESIGSTKLIACGLILFGVIVGTFNVFGTKAIIKDKNPLLNPQKSPPLSKG